jgi:hypothetical protein
VKRGMETRTFQPSSPEPFGFTQGRLSRMDSPLVMRTKIISVFCGLILLLVACCPPGVTSSIQDTAFKATFLGFSKDQHYLLARPEGSNTDVQVRYGPALTITIGQKIYVVGRLEGNTVYATQINPL